MTLSDSIKKALSETGAAIEYAALMAFISVESGGQGFAKDTGKIIIQFEPHWFVKKSPYSPTGAWSINKVDRQSKEWEAFNSAFTQNPAAAMESTSIGLPQIMGFHWKRLGYDSVGDMWDDFKVNELNQIKALIKFIENDRRLIKAILEKDWHMIATLYNGSGYKLMAYKLGREAYDISLRKAYEKYK